MKKNVTFISPLIVLALGKLVPGVLGWLLFWGGGAWFAGILLAKVAGRFIPPSVRERALSVAITTSGYSAIFFIGLIFIFVFKEAIAAFFTVPPAKFFNAVWQPTAADPKYGVLPLAASSTLVISLTTVMAVPIALGAAIFLAEFAHRREREIIKPVIELLAAIPSVVYGFMGMVILGDVIPALTGTPFRLNALNGSIVLAVMLMPMAATLTEEALFGVPKTYRTAARALGATRWEATWRVVVPAALPGILASFLLTVTRAAGETMAVLLATGNMAVLTANPLSSVRTVTATIAIEMGEAVFGSEHYHVLFALGLALFSVTFVLNLFAVRAVHNFQRRFRG